jgi:hypothetical protein
LHKFLILKIIIMIRTSNIFFFLAVSPVALFSQTISLTTVGVPYTQDFNTLSNVAGSTTNNLTINGWFMTESGGGARDNEQYGVETGASTTGDTYSYGSAASTERAFGELRSGTLIPLFGAAFTNNNGSAITSLDVSFTGEQWRLGTINRTDQLNFEYSTNATDLVTGTWTNVSVLNFISPFTTTAGARDGNAVGNRTALSSTITGLNIPNGATFWIRWTDLDATGADDGLAIDDFSLTIPVPPINLSVADVSQAETNSGTTTFTFTVSLSSPADAGGVTFDIATADGTALSSSDYVAQSLTSQTIAAGNSSYTFDVTVNGDNFCEANETFFVNVTNVTGATGTDNQAMGIISNDETVPQNPTVTSASRCGTGTVNLLASAPAGTFDWYDASSAGTLLGSGSPFSTPVISATTNYWVETVIDECISNRVQATATVNTIPNADAPLAVTACDSYTLPALTVGNYFTGTGGTGTALFAGDPITSTQSIYVYAETGTVPNCSDENSFTITINPSPVADAPSNVTACDSYTLPALTVGNYFTGIGGTGTAMNAGDVITSTQTIYVYAETGTTPNCSDENSFTITINPSPVADAPSNVTACDSYVLPALTIGNYFTGAGGTGTAMFAGDAITSTQTIYVYAETGATPNCTSENGFVVSIDNLDLSVTQNNNTLTANATGVAYRWIDCDNGNATVGTAQSYTATADGNYAVVITGAVCSDTSICYNVTTIGITERSNNVHLNIYPNPSTGSFTVHSAKEGVYSILNELGENVRSIKLNAENDYTISVENLNNGVYFICGYNKEETTYQKIVITK